MSTTVRTFVAACVPATPALRGVLDELGRIGRPVKPVGYDHLHVTLKFLGETDTSWIDQTCAILNAVTNETSAFDVMLCGLGAFPKPSRPSVIWTGIIPPAPIVQLAEKVEQALTEFGFSAEPRIFRPHVTLARVKARPPASLSDLLDKHRDTEFATLALSEVSLVKSVLTACGPRYESLFECQLQDAK